MAACEAVFRAMPRLDAVFVPGGDPGHTAPSVLIPPVSPIEFEVSRAATADGVLTLMWTEETGRGSNGRGCQLAEVWLIRADR
jgi:hypothetical protein